MPNYLNGFVDDRASSMKKASGTASAGSSTYAAAADHVHPLNTPADIGAVKLVAKPASATATGEAGSIAYESGYLYVCVAENTWQRVAIATWS